MENSINARQELNNDCVSEISSQNNIIIVKNRYLLENNSEPNTFTEIDHNHSDPKQNQVVQGRWTKREHELFLEGIQLHGKNWQKIEELVVTRSGSQIRSHAQKFFNKNSSDLASKIKESFKRQPTDPALHVIQEQQSHPPPMPIQAQLVKRKFSETIAFAHDGSVEQQDNDTLFTSRIQHQVQNQLDTQPLSVFQKIDSLSNEMRIRLQSYHNMENSLISNINFQKSVPDPDIPHLQCLEEQLFHLSNMIKMLKFNIQNIETEENEKKMSNSVGNFNQVQLSPHSPQPVPGFQETIVQKRLADSSVRIVTPKYSNSLQALLDNAQIETPKLSQLVDFGTNQFDQIKIPAHIDLQINGSQIPLAKPIENKFIGFQPFDRLRQNTM